GDPAMAQAADRGGRERVHPAVRDVEGLVGVLVLRSADERIVVVATSTALETHTEVGDRIMRTELLPGEDPALLPGYDRIHLGRVGCEIELIAVTDEPVPLPADTAALVADLDPATRVDTRPSIEPGGQFELSPAPRPDVAALVADVRHLLDRTFRVAAARGIR